MTKSELIEAMKDMHPNQQVFINCNFTVNDEVRIEETVPLTHLQNIYTDCAINTILSSKVKCK